MRLPLPTRELLALFQAGAGVLEQVKEPVLAHFDLWERTVFVHSWLEAGVDPSARRRPRRPPWAALSESAATPSTRQGSSIGAPTRPVPSHPGHSPSVMTCPSFPIFPCAHPYDRGVGKTGFWSSTSWGFDLRLSFGKQCIGLLAVSGIIASAACGISEVEPNPAKTREAQPTLGQTRQALWVDLYNEVGTPIANGNTYNAANEFTPPAGCSDGPGGPDLSFKWTVPMDGTYTINTEYPLDSVLYIYEFKADGTVGPLLGCNDDISITNLASSLTLQNLSKGKELRIVVDSYSPPRYQAGTFALNIRPEFVMCPNSPDGCKTQGTWTRNDCVYTLAPAGTACNDGNACTVNDVCNSAGACGGSPKVCNTPPGQCYASVGTCSNGSCSYAAKDEGVSCSDGRGCTRGDTCNGRGGCMSGEDSCASGYYCAASGCLPLP